MRAQALWLNFVIVRIAKCNNMEKMGSNIQEVTQEIWNCERMEKDGER
jgi:hypothetical protein